MDKTIGKNKNKNFSDKCNQIPVDHAKQYARDALKTTSRE